MGGETPKGRRSASSSAGLSPRGRGNRAGRVGAGLIDRSIPAWAGKPAVSGRPSCRAKVYPRVGGETRENPSSISQKRGLSPRGRGNLPAVRLAARPGRSIPAWAGKPGIYGWLGQFPAVYPRVGGETTRSRKSRRTVDGLSPRGRGNRRTGTGYDGSQWSIPAWAGKPDPRRPTSTSAGVYPRVGGETMLGVVIDGLLRGLSPRGRGNLGTAESGVAYRWSIPAWAGKPSCSRRRSPALRVYPRVGGETKVSSPSTKGTEGLSPRGRGNPPRSRSRRGRSRSIPAWAGKPRRLSIGRCERGVYPRVGGETSPRIKLLSVSAGLSPRGRGNPTRKIREKDIRRSIPAWAGKPLRHSDSFVCICQRSLVLLGRYGGSPAMCRIRFHTSLASGSAR